MKLRLSEILKKRLQDKNLSEVARLTGIPRQRLFDWSSIGRVPSLKFAPELQMLATYLGLTLEELVLGNSSRRTISAISFRDGDSLYSIVVEKLEQPKKE